MAKLIDERLPAEKIYTLEFTERELATLLVGVGSSRPSEREECAKCHSVSILNDSETIHLYHFLRRTLEVGR